MYWFKFPRVPVLFAALVGSLLALSEGAFAQEAAPDAEAAAAIAREAYVYGYPLVTMEMSRRVMTNVASVAGTRGPMGHLVNLKTYPNAQFRDVTAPNADTLYSSAWFDVAKEPYVLSIPDEHDRYFLMPMLSAWTDVFAVPGKRTTGTGAQTYAITGPNWKGTLPEGVKELKSPTSLVWLLGRTYCTGTPEDYETVHAIQAKYSLVPLSSYGKPYTPPEGKVDPAIDMKTPVRDQVNALEGRAYFALLASLMKDNPPAEADAPILAKMATIGVVPGEKFDFDNLSPVVCWAMTTAPKAAQAEIMGHYKNAGTDEAGWIFTTKTGLYGTDYLQRALIAAIGLGANRPQDAVYPTSQVDAAGQPYDGANKYVLHFPKGQTPPAQGFWSLTMYDGGYFFVDNPLNRYTLSPRDALKYNEDGSLDLYLQKDSPGKEQESNWLPAPEGKFILMMRLYWPTETPPSIIDGSWKPPGVKKAS